MKRIRNKNKKTLIIVALLVVITLGYAYLSQMLTINGTGTIDTMDWDIHFESYQVTANNNMTPTTVPDTSGNNKTSITYAVAFDTPGQVYEFTVDAVNDGTIDAMIKSYTSTIQEGSGEVKDATDPSNIPSYLTYTITYSDDVAIAANHLLAANSSETIKVHLELNKNISTAELSQASGKTITLTTNINYEQPDGNEQEVIHPINGTRYTTNIWNDNGSTINNGTNPSLVWIGQAPSNNITLYETVDAAKQAYSNRPFYLKHTLVNGVVTESYVCFEKDSNTYCIRGEKTSELVSGNWQCKAEYDDGNGNCVSQYYESNKTILQSVFAASECSSYVAAYRCQVDSLHVAVTRSGRIGAGDKHIVGGIHSNYCGIDNYGYSGCDEE